MANSRSNHDITTFGLSPGRVLARKYEVLSLLGAGWEGEVYKIREVHTGVVRAGKFFFPKRNVGGKAARIYAQKLHKLRDCPILIQYHTQDSFKFRGQEVAFLVSEFVEGELLSKFLSRQPGQRISAFQGMHLLHALAEGMESIHNMREYHGDLHTDNVMISRYGISFDLKLIDMFYYGRGTAADMHDDVCDMVRIFYDSVGGAKHYPRQPQEVKAICCGLKRSLILKKFRTAAQLRKYLETMKWE